VQDIFHIENQAIECVTSYKYLGIKNVENIGVKTPLCLTPTSDLKGCVSLLPSLTDR
jgi:hypothetical protein